MCLNLYAEQVHLMKRGDVSQNAPCPNCLGRNTECFDGNETGNAWLCDDCSHEFLVTPNGETIDYGQRS